MAEQVTPPPPHTHTRPHHNFNSRRRIEKKSRMPPSQRDREREAGKQAGRQTDRQTESDRDLPSSRQLKFVSLEFKHLGLAKQTNKTCVNTRYMCMFSVPPHKTGFVTWSRIMTILWPLKKTKRRDFTLAWIHPWEMAYSFSPSF